MSAASQQIEKSETTGSTKSTSLADPGTKAPVGHKNTVRQLIEEVCNLMSDTHDLREEAMARGVQFHTLNVMIEMGIHEKPEEQAEMMKTALAASKKAHGSAAISQEKLQDILDSLVLLEKDIGHVRRMAQLQKINMQAFNFLTQIIRLNPGDGGEKSVNDFIAYAALCNINIEKFPEVAEKFGSDRKSVLPEIDEIEFDKKRADRIKLRNDIAVGLAIGASVFWIFF